MHSSWPRPNGRGRCTWNCPKTSPVTTQTRVTLRRPNADEWKQAGEGFADFGMTFGNPDFVDYARVRRDRPAPYQGTVLSEVLEQAFEHGGVAPVDCPIDYYTANSELDEEHHVPERVLAGESDN